MEHSLPWSGTFNCGTNITLLAIPDSNCTFDHWSGDLGGNTNYSQTSFTIDVDKCTGCTICAKKCPTDAIIGSRKKPHFVVDDKCIACGTCFDVCKFDAIVIS